MTSINTTEKPFNLTNIISYIKEWLNLFAVSVNATVSAAIIGHVRYINILTWLRGFWVKLLYLVLFSLYSSLFWGLRDKRNLKNLQFWPESLGAMLEYWYIERGLLGSFFCHNITNFNAANSEMFRVNTFVNFLFFFRRGENKQATVEIHSFPF